MKSRLGKISSAFFVLVLALGVVYLTPNALTHAWVKMSGSSKACFLRWWLAQSVHAQGSGGSSSLNFTTFDAPGAGTGILQGTLPVSINATGVIAGVFVVAGPVAHGFVRDANGTITNFDAPDAGTGKNQGTFPVNINAAGAIAGDYFDKNNVYHGFVRGADGSITEFDVPGAGTVQFDRGTSPTSIDTAGDITGFYKTDTNTVRHGFVRAASGAITTFDVPGAGTAFQQGTIPLSINTVGNITGVYVDASGASHGFVRAVNSTITAPIDAPGAATGGCAQKLLDVSSVGTIPISIDSAGDITGIYNDTSCVRHGFVRSANGTFSSFDAPGAVTPSGSACTTKGSPQCPLGGTNPVSINTAGDTTGLYEDAGGVFHGFKRSASGTITSPIDVPGAGMLGTGATSINDSGEITGVYSDANVVFHGFLSFPVNNPVPTITGSSPTSAIAGGPAFTLTVNGTNFVSGSTVNFNGNGRTTTFVSATQLTAVILASDIATAGTFNVTVTNPSGGTSNAVSFTVVTPQDATGTIANSVNVLFSQGVINGGQDNSLVVQLQHAISMMNAGKDAGAIGNLDSFISEVNDLLSSGVLSPSQAASLISAAQSVIAALP